MIKKEILHENKFQLRLAVGSLVLFLLIGLSIFFFVEMQNTANDKAVKECLERLTYTEKQMDEELRELRKLSTNSLMSDKTKGELFTAMAEISYMNKDDMVYNRYVASALYYLNKSDNRKMIFYLSHKYIGRLYANGCYESAGYVLSSLGKQYDISALELKERVGYYLSCADVEQMRNWDCTKNLTEAQSGINMMSEGSERSLQQAKLDLLIARNYINKNDFDAAAAIMEKYKEQDDFGFDPTQVYVICDYRIPYYEISAKLLLHNNKLPEAYQQIEKYLRACDDFNFRTMKLHMLQYVVQWSGRSHIDGMERYQLLEQSVSKENLHKMTDEYGNFLLSDISLIKFELEQQDEPQQSIYRYATIGLVCLSLLILGYCFASAFMKDVNKDGLTRLYNRKLYERARIVCERSKYKYGLVMFDIDNFKRINDTFGHLIGDRVLRDIAAIMLRYTGRGVTAYRYGGEEMCMVFYNVPEKRVREVAEEIRKLIEQEVGTVDMPVTISGGLAMSENGENVFQKADMHLYDAKRSGKNKIV